MIFKIGHILQHYASKYYDPIKAHDYYMRNRELKGRLSSANLNQEGKEKWRYVKSQITEEKKQNLAIIKTEKDNKIQSFRDTSKVQSQKLSSSLTNQLEVLKKPETLLNMPTNPSQETRIRINRLNAGIRERNSKLSEENKLSREKIRQNIKEKRINLREKISKDITSARDLWMKKKEDIMNKYKNTLELEYNNILNKFGKGSASKSITVTPIGDDATYAKFRNEETKKRLNK